MSGDEMLALAPFVLVVLLAITILLVDLFWPRRDDLIMALGVGGLVVALVATLLIGPLPWDVGLLDGPQTVGDPALYSRDLLTSLLDVTFISIALLTLLFAPDYLEPRKMPLPEFTVSLLFAISGGMLIAGGQDLLVLFIGLELLVLPGYILAGFAKRDGLSTEGAIKYFLLGSFSSAILLFGLAFVMGYTGSTSLPAVASVLDGVVNGGASLPLALAMGLALLAVGLLFKIAAVPFHYWTPDAYQGSPTPVTGYLSVGPKVAAFALILRIFVEALGPLRGEWALVIGILAGLTMTVGNLAALGQDNIKRMLAYSAIAHTGYIMVGVVVFATAQDQAIATDGVQGVLFYAVAYAFMNLGAFAVVAALAAATGCDQPDQQLQRPRLSDPGVGPGHDRVPAVAGGHPAAGRLLRQDDHRAVGPGGRRAHDAAGGADDAQRRHGRLLLPARGRLHVHAPAGRGRPAGQRGPGHQGRARPGHGRGHRHRPLPHRHRGHPGVDRSGRPADRGAGRLLAFAVGGRVER